MLSAKAHIIGLPALFLIFVSASTIFAQTTSEDDNLAEDDQSYPCHLTNSADGALTVYPSQPDNVGAENPDVCLYNKTKKVTCIQVKGAFNASSAAITCKDQAIEIFSTQGAMATSINLRFNGKKLEQNQKKNERVDLNKGADKTYAKALQKGDVKGAITAVDDKLYPNQSVSVGDTCKQLMVIAHKSAQGALRKKNWASAVQTIEPAWSWCNSNLKGTFPADLGKQPKFILALNDYGFALEQQKQYPLAESVLRHVIQLDAGRTAAYLNLGDALAGQKKDANSAYDEYCQHTPKNKWPNRIEGLATHCKK